MYKPSIYIAGPMRGIPRMNFPAFDAAKKRLMERGSFSLVMSPADLDRAMLKKPNDWLPEPAPLECYDCGEGAWEILFDHSTNSCINMKEVWRKDMCSIIDCDAIYMLEGWERSKGAMIELQLASLLNKDIYYEANDESAI